MSRVLYDDQSDYEYRVRPDCGCLEGNIYEQGATCDLHAECVRCKHHGIGTEKRDDGACFNCLSNEVEREA